MSDAPSTAAAPAAGGSSSRPRLPPVLVSACLLGSPVRYDGRHKAARHEVLRRWLAQGRVVPICPELAGGLPVPRAPAEIAGGAGGAAVLRGVALVVDNQSRDVTAAFIAGAERALELALEQGARVAVLKEDSPSCGTSTIYDGQFRGARVPGQGVTAARLAAAGLQVFSELQWAQADACLQHLDAAEPR